MKQVFRALEGVTEQLQTPEPIVIRDTLEANAARMQAFADQHGLALRPHAKTHKCVEIAQIQLDAGAEGLTVGTLTEAEVFAEAGVRKLFLAFPVHAVGARAARIASLHQATALRVGIDTPVSADALAAAVKGSTRRLEVVIEVDCGAHRSGVQPEQAGALAAHAAAAGLAPVGVYTYPGHGARPDARRPAADDQLQALTTAVESLRDVGVEAELVSAGSTPTVAFSARGPITEIRPGEYIFADMDNVRLDACAEDDVALFVAGTVVSDTMPEHVIVDVGTKALGREGNPDKGYGYALGLGETCLHKLNEYHGFLSVASDQRPKVGTVIPIVPNHCCPLVNNFAELVVTDSEGRGLDRWAVAARGT